MLLPSLLSEISSHDLEVAETLIGILRFVSDFRWSPHSFGNFGAARAAHHSW